MYYLLLPSLERRQALILHLKERGILSVFHYLPLHLSEVGRKFGGQPGDCAVTETVSDCLLRLPFFNELTESDQARVVAGLLEKSPDGIPVPAIRDALHSSRKHVVPLLEHLDAIGVTRRRGDVRIAGPRLPEPGA